MNKRNPKNYCSFDTLVKYPAISQNGRILIAISTYRKRDYWAMGSPISELSTS
jgi:hypothetical protein